MAVRPDEVFVLQERLAGTRPRLRGAIHAIAAPLAAAGTAALVLRAASGLARLGGVVFGASLVALFATSAAYHRIDWSPAWALRMKRADHVAIVVALAGTYTPFALLALDGALAVVVLVVGWVAVLASIAVAALGWFERRGVAITVYLVLGWAAVLMTPSLAGRLPGGDLVLLIAGGVVYSLGAAVLATRWPDPSPRWFGFHEIWHAHTVVAAALHGAVVWSLVSRATI